MAASPFVAKHYAGCRAAACALDGYAPGRLLAVIKRAAERALTWGPDRILEAVSRAVYSRYLRSRAGRWKSPDQVDLSGDQLKLHTMSHRRVILDRFEARVGQMVRQAAQVRLTPAGR